MYRLTSRQDARQSSTAVVPQVWPAAYGPHSILSRIGNTPLLRLQRVRPSNRSVEIFAKAEWFNPGGSVKDRAALAMIAEGERSGALSKGKTIIDATSGNTGIAYAMIGSVLGYPVSLALPANASPERKQILRAYGAELILTDPGSGTDGAQELVRELVRRDPDRFFYPDQYNNDANWLAHYETTGAEIWDQSEHAVTHFVAGVGTTGTFVGTGRKLKELNPAVTLVTVEPDSPLHGLEGMKHLATALVPGIYDPALPDIRLTVETEDAYDMVRRLAREEGLYVGVSSGAAMVACLRLAEGVPSGTIVTVFPDGGSRYGSEHFWDASQDTRLP